MHFLFLAWWKETNERAACQPLLAHRHCKAFTVQCAWHLVVCFFPFSLAHMQLGFFSFFLFRFSSHQATLPERQRQKETARTMIEKIYVICANWIQLAYLHSADFAQVQLKPHLDEVLISLPIKSLYTKCSAREWEGERKNEHRVMLNANNGERIVMRIELTAPTAEAATGADEEYERRKNFNNNSFVYCGIGKTLLANMLCANHGKNWIDKAVTKKIYYTSCKNLLWEAKIIIFVAEFAVLQHFKRCRTAPSSSSLLVFFVSFSLLGHLRVRMYLCILQSTAVYLDLTTVYGSARKKKRFLRRNEKKWLNRFHEYVDVTLCLRRRARAHGDSILGLVVRWMKKNTV